MALGKSVQSAVMAAGLLTLAPMTQAASLQGLWAGDRLQLVIDAQGGRVESDCASGHFAGPVTASADGKFNLQGSFENHQPGPQRADSTTQTSAQYSGELQGGALKLSITPAGASEAQVYTLQAGARIKLLRCL
jgi:hypothetical protein